MFDFLNFGGDEQPQHDAHITEFLAQSEPQTGGLFGGLLPSLNSADQWAAGTQAMAEHDAGNGTLNVASFSLTDGVGITPTGQKLLIGGVVLAALFLVLK